MFEFRYIYKGFVILIEAATQAEADKEYNKLIKGEEG